MAPAKRTERLSPEEYQRVLTFFERAVQEEPDKWSYWCDIGFCRGKLGRWGEAATALEKIVDKTEDTSSVLSMLGHAYLHLERYPEAEAVLAKAHALAPDNLGVLYKMAVTHFYRGELAKALPPLREIIARQPRHIKAHFSIGLIAHRLGDEETAQRHIAILQDLDPAFADRLRRIVFGHSSPPPPATGR